MLFENIQHPFFLIQNVLCLFKKQVDVSKNIEKDTNNDNFVILDLKKEFRSQYINDNLIRDLPLSTNAFDDLIVDEDLNEYGSKNNQYFYEPTTENENDVKNLLGYDYMTLDFITNVEERYKTLIVCQKKVADYIKHNMESQFLIFVSGPGGTGKSLIC